MRISVAAAFTSFTSRFEGVVSFMYLDVLGLVTTGIGNLIDPSGLALDLPWRAADGRLATRREIAAEWMNVKSRQDMKMQGGMAYRSVTKLRLDGTGIDMLVARKLAQNEAELRRRFPDFDSWPADAQLATHSMAWACGPAFRFPKLGEALLQRDFRQAAEECHMNEDGADRIKGTADDNRGLAPRNVANKILYKNAACVVGMHLDPEELFYPTDLEAATAANEVPTLTEVPNPASEPTIHVVPNMLDAYTHLRDGDEE